MQRINAVPIADYCSAKGIEVPAKPQGELKPGLPEAVEVTEVLDHANGPDEWSLVHDGARVIGIAKPGARVECGRPGCTMVFGTKEEIDAEVAALKLTRATQG